MGLFSSIGKVFKSVGGTIFTGKTPWGDVPGLGGGDDAGDKNAEMQKSFAQNGIRWKVEDAKRAGIHPLYALGAQTHSFTPSYIDGGASDMSDFGQNVSRAINATRTRGERQNAVVEALSTERMQLENDLLRSQIRRTNMVGPAMPSPTDTPIVPGSGDVFGPTRLSPTDLVATDPGQPFKEAGAVSEMTWARTPGGGVAPVPLLKIGKIVVRTSLVPSLVG